MYALAPFNTSLIAVSTAWFAIFITIGVVASSYANQLTEERIRLQYILNNSQDGMFCINLNTLKIQEINEKCSGWLNYNRDELVGRNLEEIWIDATERERFVADVKDHRRSGEIETQFLTKEGSGHRVVLSAVLLTRDRVLCSLVDTSDSKIIDDEIRKSLEDLEEQVRQRTEHLVKINEELRTEILELRQKDDELLFPGGRPPQSGEK